MGLADRQGIAKGEFGLLQCTSCGTGLTMPQVSEVELAGFYDSGYGPHQAGPAITKLAEAVMAARLRTRLFRSLLRNPGSAVDFGSGRGDLLRVLKARGWTVYGVEASTQAAESATESGVPTEATTMDGANLEPMAFDAAIFHHSLEHTGEPLRSLVTAHRSLRKGGRVFVSVPNFGSHASQRLRESWWALDLPRHRLHFTSVGLEEILRRAGFRNVKIRETASCLGPAANLQERIRGRFSGGGLIFLVSFGLGLAAFPLVWTRNELQGGGEFLTATAIR